MSAYHKGTNPDEDDEEGAPAPDDADIARRLRAGSPDGRFDGHSDEALVQLFRRNQRVLARTDEDVIAAMTRPR